MLNLTFNNISVILWQSVLLVKENGENQQHFVCYRKLDHIIRITADFKVETDIITSIVMTRRVVRLVIMSVEILKTDITLYCEMS